MELTTIYAIATGGLYSIFILLRALRYFTPLISTISILISKHLTYPYFLDRHISIGPWTRAGVLVHMFYAALNVFFAFSFWFHPLLTFAVELERWH